MWACIIENKKGQQLKLHPNENYIVEITSGLEPPPVENVFTKISGVDGSSLNSSTSGSRNMLFQIYPQYPVDINRVNLYKYFKKKELIKIYYKNELRNVYIEGVVDTFECDHHANPQAATISIICPDPYFNDVVEIVEDISKLSSMFEFPFSISKEGIPFSEFNEFLIAEVTNKGDIDSGIIIELHANGTVENPVIHNADTRETFALNFTMQASDVIKINTIEGQQRIELIRSGVSTNIINSIVEGSEWLQAVAGVNFYTYTVDSGLDNLSVKFKPRIAYEGV